MKIKNKVVYVYDIEVFPNCFHASVKKAGDTERYHFEISERKNQLDELNDFFTNTTDKFICGYNCIHYDNPIINFIINNYTFFKSLSYIQICQEIYNLSNTIITSENSLSWSKWKYGTKFETLDLLTMLFSKNLRVGLKEMQVTMKFRNVQEYNGDFSKPIKKEDIDEMIKYNDNDVDSTEELLFKCTEEIKLRLGIEQEYGIDALSKDGVTIGMEILKVKYLEKTGKTWKDIENLRSPCDTVDLEKIILPIVKFELPELQKLLGILKNQHKISPGRNGFKYNFLLDGVEVNVGVGGIHTRNDPEIIIPTENEVLLDSDVALAYSGASKTAQIAGTSLEINLPKRNND